MTSLPRKFDGPARSLRVHRLAARCIGIDYAITGAQAIVTYGRPRLTLDIDLLIAIPGAKFSDFMSCFAPDDFCADEQVARAVMHSGGIFNFLHLASGVRIDFIVPTNDADWAAIEDAERRTAFEGV